MVDPYRVVPAEINGLSLNIPVILKDLFDFINSEIIEGIFRINGSLKKINYYYSNLQKYNRWLKDANIYDICSLLKKILITNYHFIDTTKLDLSQLNEFTEDTFNWEYFNKFINNNMNLLNLNIFIYTLNFMSNLLQHNEETKMSLLNFSIIFQPIFFTCDNLICLPNYINLLNYLFNHKDRITIDDSLVDKEFKLSLQEVEFKNEDTINDSFMYKFKNFKNKSIDSINDIGKKLQFSNDFKGYRLSNKSVEMLTKTVEEDHTKLKDSDSSNIDDIDKSVEIDDSGSVLSQKDDDVPQQTQHVSIDTIDGIDFTQESPKSTLATETIEKYESAKDSISGEPSPQFDDSFVDSFQSLAPETKPRTYHFYNMHIKADEAIDPLSVDPEVNELVQLEDIDTKSFQFNIDIPNSPSSSFHSSNSKTADSDDFHEYTHRNNSSDTNDTSFHSNNGKADKITHSSVLRSKSSSISTNSHTPSIHSTASLTAPSPLADPSVRSRSSNSNIGGSRRNSRLLTRIESRFSTAGDRSSIIEKRKSFIKLFKNDGGMKLSLKLKSKSVY